jgi:predicted ATP-binding protein involved in virulence
MPQTNSDSLKINSITLKNVGPFDDEGLTINFGSKQNKEDKNKEDKANVHILVGENGSGKSTILYAIANTFIGVHGIMTGVTPLNSKISIENVDNLNIQVNFVEKENDYISIVSKFDEKDTQRIYLDENKNIQTKIILNSNLSYYESLKTNTNAYKNIVSNKLFLTYSGRTKVLEGEAVASIGDVQINPYHQSLTFNNTVDPNTIINWIAAALTNINLGDESGLYSGIIQKIYDFTIQILDLNKSEFHAKMLTAPLRPAFYINQNYVSFGGLSDGYKSILSLICDVVIRIYNVNWEAKNIKPENQKLILFLDEIDIHLHPTWQRKILPALQKLFPNAEILCTTHSPFVVNSVSDAWVYELKDGKLKDRRLTQLGDSYGYSLIEDFGISGDFSYEVNVELKNFFDLIYKYEEDNVKNSKVEIQDLAKKLMNYGEEVKQIVIFNLKKYGLYN